MGTMWIVILVAVLAVGLAIGVGAASGLLRIERVGQKDMPEDNEKYNPEDYPPLPDMESPVDLFNQDPAGQPEEKYEFDHFADPEPEETLPPPQEEEAEPPPREEEFDEASFDKLCEAKTGRAFLLDCQKLLQTARSEGVMYGLAYIDFDRFRFLNTLKGHSLGDYALTHMAQELPGIFPEGSLTTRLCADHFVVLFPLLAELVLEEYLEQIKRVAERIRDDVGMKNGLRICMGVAYTVEPRDYDITLLIQKANIARHCMKTSKTDTCGQFDSSMLDTMLFGESAMEDYNEHQYNDDCLIYFQPVADVKLGRITCCDALVRWKCLQESYRDVPLSADNGRIPTNNMKIIYQVCKSISRWRKAGKSINYHCVYLPAIDLFKNDIDSFLAQCMNDFQVEPKSIIVQVDLEAARLNWDIAAKQLRKIRDLGCNVAVTGIDRNFTSLEPLTGLPVNYVKLHKSFVGNLERDPARVEGARQIIASANSMGILTIFEGVDNQEQSRILKEAGAHYAQGRVAGAPAQTDDFVGVLQSYVVKQSHYGNATNILDDDALAKGELHVY